MLAERVEVIRYHFGVQLIDYQRPSTGVLFTSGCGLGLALMDECPNLRWFVDTDSYRRQLIDWECLAVLLSIGRPEVIILAGWFSLDRPETFTQLKLGIIDVPHLTYIGGETSLTDFIQLTLGLAKSIAQQ